MTTPNAGCNPASSVPDDGTSFHVPPSSSDAGNRHDSEETQSSEVQQLAAISELVARVSSATSVGAAAQALANELHRYVKCREVIVGIRRSQPLTCTATAISGRTSIDSNSEYVRMADAALEECVNRSEASHWPPRDPQNRHALMAHRQFGEYSNAASIMTTPLSDASQHIRGAILIVGEAEPDEGTRRFLHAAEQPLASTLGLQIRAEGSRVARFLDGMSAYGMKKHRHRIAAIVALTILVLSWPVRYRIACECELHPVVRRYVAAPFDGRLEKNFVAPGDIVKAGDFLARIDARDITWELSGKRAEVHRVTKERAGYLAGHESGKVELANLELDRLKLEIERLEHRVENLDIRSAISGIVVDGDLSKSEGVPLETGKPLFEIAPLDQMVVEVWVPEDDVRFLEIGLPVSVRLDAYPLSSRDSRIKRIHPRAELRDHDNVFIVEAAIDNTAGSLRPGMHGDAKIAAMRKSLGWVLFHRSLAATLAWLGW